MIYIPIVDVMQSNPSSMCAYHLLPCTQGGPGEVYSCAPPHPHRECQVRCTHVPPHPYTHREGQVRCTHVPHEVFKSNSLCRYCLLTKGHILANTSLDHEFFVSLNSRLLETGPHHKCQLEARVVSLLIQCFDYSEDYTVYA